jgi:opacity protein-like surface antigen
MTSFFDNRRAALLLCAISLAVPAAAPMAQDTGATTVSQADGVGALMSETDGAVYVRGDIGVGQLEIGDLSQSDVAANGGSFLSHSVDDTFYIGLGIGLQLNRNIRVDATGEYRGTVDVKALDNLTGDLLLGDGTVDGRLQSNTLYEGNLSSYVGLLNGYVDLMSWNGFTPYLGAGIGLAHNRMTGTTFSANATFTDAVTGDIVSHQSNGTSVPQGQTNVAWALMAGTSYDISSNAKLDVGYRYLNLGSGVALSTDLLNCTCGTIAAPLTGDDLDSHEVRIGLRWELDPPPR